jgi:hypothetical protein
MPRALREIRAKDLLSDIRSGTDDIDLMCKYQMTRRQLKSAMKKLDKLGVLTPIERLLAELSVRELASEMQSGVDRETLIAKYGLSVEEYYSLRQRFCSLGAVSCFETQEVEVPPDEEITWGSLPSDVLEQTEPTLELVQEMLEPVRSKLLSRPDANHRTVPFTLISRLDQNPEEVLRLLDEGTDVNARDYQLQRPLLGWAAGYGNKELVKLLLERGASVNLADKRGRTPLTLAVERGHSQVAEILLLNGAK